MKKRVLCLLLTLVLWDVRANEKTTEGRGYYAYDNLENPQAPKDALLLILEELKLQTSILKELLNIQKTYSGVPQVVEINGKTCLENSSADCFVMPLANDALRIPVMAEWIKNPSVENALKYYEWQAKYLNHAFDAGYALNFASMKVPYAFAGVSPIMQGGNNASKDQRNEQLDKVIAKNASGLELKIFLGKSNFDLDNTTRLFDIYYQMKSLGVKTRFIFEKIKDLEDFAQFNKKAPNENYAKHWNAIPKEDKVISPNSFKGDSKIYLTPMFLLSYHDFKKKQNYNEIVGAGREKVESIKERMKNFLLLFKIASPQEFNDQQDSTIPIDNNLRDLENEGILKDEGEEGRRAREFKRFLEGKKRGE